MAMRPIFIYEENEADYDSPYLHVHASDRLQVINIEVGESQDHATLRLPHDKLNDLIRALLKELNAGAAPELVGAEPLVLYFGNDADRDEMIAVCTGSFKNLKTIKL